MKKLKYIHYVIFIVTITIFNSSFVFCADENLDEMMARKIRKTENEFYSGESVENNYLWQSQTLCYNDLLSNHEIWVMTNIDDANALSGSEYGYQPWSADGRWFSVSIDKLTSAFSHSEYYGDETWFTYSSDGKILRPRIDSPARIMVHAAYTQWSPVEPDVYYEFGRRYSGQSNMDSNMLYKVTVDNNASTSFIPWIDFIIGNESSERDLPKDSISSDGKYILATAFAEQGTVTIGDLASQTIKTNEYDMDRSLDPHWVNTPTGNTADWHDEMFVGADGDYWIYFVYTSGSWWRMRPWGTDGNAPNHTNDITEPYDWWSGAEAQKEVQPVNGHSGNMPFLPTYYWSHGVPDRWGTHFAYSDVAGSYPAPGVWDVENHTRIAKDPKPSGVQYSVWTGWTDYTAGTKGADFIYSMKYNDGSSHSHIASIHATIGGQFTKPGQSPDGTKTAFRSDFLQPTNTNGDVLYVVAYYPYPPEITECSADFGTVNIKFDWQNTLSDPNPRTYTTRGWPDESVDDRPIPRETKKYRLWRSQNNSDWTPVESVDAEHFTRFDFANGGFKSGQNSYWEITDTPGDGTWYYAVTSVEHSGLESRSLSNSWKVEITDGSIVNGGGEGTQETGYPSDPGGVSNFWTTLPPVPSNFVSTELPTPGHYQLTWDEPEDARSLIRYYNIYYSSTGTPSAIQQNRIASVTVGTDRWLDWLADSSAENGYYKITSVDTQGNEGTGDDNLNTDINNDGSINIQDVVLCINIILNTASGNGDVNNDGQTNVQDVTAIVNQILTE